jgi:hypothetical protein
MRNKMLLRTLVLSVVIGTAVFLPALVAAALTPVNYHTAFDLTQDAAFHNILRSTKEFDGTPEVTTSGPTTPVASLVVGATLNQSFSLPVSPGVANVIAPLVITTSELSAGSLGQRSRAQLQALGEVPPYTWSVAGGPLPLGLNLDASTGAITGTPTETGAFSVTIQVRDSSLPRNSARLVIKRVPLKLGG